MLSISTKVTKNPLFQDSCTLDLSTSIQKETDNNQKSKFP